MQNTSYLERRARRLTAPRPISDPVHGLLGEIQRTTVFSPDKTKWVARDKEGLDLGTFHTSRVAINALCDANKVPRWFPERAALAKVRGES
jgi:hypothetical protein